MNADLSIECWFATRGNRVELQSTKVIHPHIGKREAVYGEPHATSAPFTFGHNPGVVAMTIFLTRLAAHWASHAEPSEPFSLYGAQDEPAGALDRTRDEESASYKAIFGDIDGHTLFYALTERRNAKGRKPCPIVISPKSAFTRGSISIWRGQTKLTGAEELNRLAEQLEQQYRREYAPPAPLPDAFQPRSVLGTALGLIDPTLYPDSLARFATYARQNPRETATALSAEAYLFELASSWDSAAQRACAAARLYLQCEDLPGRVDSAVSALLIALRSYASLGRGRSAASVFDDIVDSLLRPGNHQPLPHTVLCALTTAGSVCFDMGDETNGLAFLRTARSLFDERAQRWETAEGVKRATIEDSVIRRRLVLFRGRAPANYIKARKILAAEIEACEGRGDPRGVLSGCVFLQCTHLHHGLWTGVMDVYKQYHNRIAGGHRASAIMFMTLAGTAHREDRKPFEAKQLCRAALESAHEVQFKAPVGWAPSVPSALHPEVSLSQMESAIPKGMTSIDDRAKHEFNRDKMRSLLELAKRYGAKDPKRDDLKLWL